MELMTQLACLASVAFLRFHIARWIIEN